MTNSTARLWNDSIYHYNNIVFDNHGRFFFFFFYIQTITASSGITGYTCFLKMINVMLWQITCIINLHKMFLFNYGLLILVQTSLKLFCSSCLRTRGHQFPCHYSWLALLSWKHNFTPFPLSRVRPHILLAPDVYCHSIRPENYSKVKLDIKGEYRNIGNTARRSSEHRAF